MTLKAQEELIERGSWIEHFDLFKLKSADGITRLNVHVDPALGSYRLWVYFDSPYRPSYYAELTMQWRRRRA